MPERLAKGTWVEIHAVVLPAGERGTVYMRLGQADFVERLEVRWPSGTRDVLEGLPADRLITITEGSSPAGTSP